MYLQYKLQLRPEQEVVYKRIALRLERRPDETIRNPVASSVPKRSRKELDTIKVIENKDSTLVRTQQ